MENDENENFDQLRKLLALKKHESPPPGYFNRLPSEVISQIRIEQRTDVDVLTRLSSEAPWLLRLWHTLAAKPALAAVFGGGVCALVLAGIFFAEKPDAPPAFMATSNPQQGTPFLPVAAVNPAAGVTLTQPMLVTSTNATGIPNLFDLVHPGQAMPASVGGLR